MSTFQSLGRSQRPASALGLHLASVSLVWWGARGASRTSAAKHSHWLPPLLRKKRGSVGQEMAFNGVVEAERGRGKERGEGRSGYFTWLDRVVGEVEIERE